MGENLARNSARILNLVNGSRSNINPPARGDSETIRAEEPSLESRIRGELMQEFEKEAVQIPVEGEKMDEMQRADERVVEDSQGITAQQTELGEDVFICKNIAEKLVEAKVLEMMERLEMCSCSRCFHDVMALALNDLPPKYVVTRKGELMALAYTYESQKTIDVVTAVMRACSIVKDHPVHG